MHVYTSPVLSAVAKLANQTRGICRYWATIYKAHIWHSVTSPPRSRI